MTTHSISPPTSRMLASASVVFVAASAVCAHRKELGMELSAPIGPRPICIGALTKSNAVMTAQVTKDDLGTHLRGRLFESCGCGFISGFSRLGECVLPVSRGSSISLEYEREIERRRKMRRSWCSLRLTRPRTTTYRLRIWMERSTRWATIVSFLQMTDQTTRSLEQPVLAADGLCLSMFAGVCGMDLKTHLVVGSPFEDLIPLPLGLLLGE